MTEEGTFRADVRAWLSENCPPEKRGPMNEGDHCFGGRNWQFKNDAQRLWLDRMAARGWTAPEWPREYGGGGLTPFEAQILREEMAEIEAHAPLTSLGIWMLGPALLRFGTETQKQKYLPAIVRGEVRWCQGYSEPNAGSDLASLQTRAEPTGDEYVVNGAKIWTSYGHLSDAIFCLVRTDPAKPRHGGISFLLIDDMTVPGVKASPLKLISGAEHFSQVFFDDVHVPRENLVGVQDRGWDVAKYLLLFERAMIGGRTGDTTRLPAFALKHLGAEGIRAEPMLRAKIIEMDMELAAFETMVERYDDEAAAGMTPGAKASMLKYWATELAVRRFELAESILGTDGLDMESKNAKTTVQWLAALPNRIGGGTSEIQLNVVAKRVLELPGA